MNRDAAGGIEPGSPKAKRPWARVLRRRLQEPPQSRWAQAGLLRTTGESPIPALIRKKNGPTEVEPFKFFKP